MLNACQFGLLMHLYNGFEVDSLTVEVRELDGHSISTATKLRDLAFSFITNVNIY
jgi:hypothetical protein